MNSPSKLAAAGLTAALTAMLAIPALAVTAGPAAAASKPGKSIRAWGFNAFGQLGDGTTTDSGTPVRVKLPKGVKITQVRAGCHHTLALTTKGRLRAWGDNDAGQLGDGTNTNSDVPVKVRLPHGTKVIAVRAGCDFSLALTSKGHLLAWGYNGNGQLGDGTTTDSDTPVRVSLPSGTKVTAISAGNKFSLARTSKGHALAWGGNIGGQLGSGSTTDSDTPVKVRLPRRAKVKALAAGGGHSLASTSGGRLYSWGLNGSGQLGDGSTTDSDRPVRLSFPVSGHVTSLFAGCDHSLALLSSGTLLAWGLNNEGQLGDDGNINQDTPVKVLLPAGAKVRAVSAGCVDSYALTAKGHVLAWGDNALGQLGDGGTTSSDVPVRIELPGGWRASAIGAGPGAAHALAIVHRG